MAAPNDDHVQDIVSARALLKERDYIVFWCSRWTGGFAAQIQSVAMGWQMYAIARQTRSVEESAFLVGMIGLARPPTGTTARPCCCCVSRARSSPS
jgi:hypothetical protein